MKISQYLIPIASFLLGGGMAFGLLAPNYVASPIPTPTATVSPTLLPYTMDRDEIMRAVNEQRIAAKVPTVAYDNTLQAFAKKRLAEVEAESEKSGRCSHDGFDLSTVPKETHRNIAENLACNVLSTTNAMKLWEESPTHKAAMLDGQYSQITIETDGKFAVVLFSTVAYAE